MPKKKQGVDTEQVITEIKKLHREVSKHLKTAKSKYDKLDDRTKEKVVKGVAGAAAVLVALGAAHKVKSKIKKRKSGK